LPLLAAQQQVVVFLPLMRPMGGAKSKWSDADYKRMGITHGGYGNSH